MKNYLESPVIPQEEANILKFWENYPSKVLQDLSNQILSVPGSSVPSERVFSDAGKIISDRRNKLKEDKYNKLKFLKYNSWLMY